MVGLGGNAPATIEFSVDGVNFGPSPVTVSGGTYTVIAQDVYGCPGTMSESVVVGPAAIEVNAMAMAEVCFEGNDGEVSWAPVGVKVRTLTVQRGSDHVHVGVGFGP